MLYERRRGRIDEARVALLALPEAEGYAVSGGRRASPGGCVSGGMRMSAQNHSRAFTCRLGQLGALPRTALAVENRRHQGRLRELTCCQRVRSSAAQAASCCWTDCALRRVSGTYHLARNSGSEDGNSHAAVGKIGHVFGVCLRQG